MKRVFDFIVSLFGLVLLAPVFLAISIWIKLDSPGPIFFRQTRIGQFSIPFEIHKFRTMVVNTESLGIQITVGNDRRITKSGAFLRKYKLDELPQLIDVLFGQMSLVGPRPEVPKYVAHYPLEIREKVLSIRPGVTDYASILYHMESDLLGKSSDPEYTYIEKILPEKLKMNIDYVNNRSFWGDVKVIYSTLSILVR